MIQTIKKINSFRNYVKGWSFGEGQAFNNKIVEKAIDLVKFSSHCGFREMDAFPGLNGEIMVTLYFAQEYWEFTIEPNESVTFVYECDDEVILYKEKLKFKNILERINSIAIEKFIVASHNNMRLFNNKLCGSLEFSTSNITTLERKDLRVLHSNHLLMEASLFSIKNVYWSKNKQFVRILENTTHPPQVAIPRFSGNLKNRYFPTNAN